MLTKIKRAARDTVKLWQRLPVEWQIILSLFVATRLMLTFIGYATRKAIGEIDPATYNGVWQYIRESSPAFSSVPWLDIWGRWDSSWYYSIATHGYTHYVSPEGQANIVFFPLFPILTFLLSLLLTNTFIAGLIVANLGFIAAAWLLYKIVYERWHDLRLARDSVLFMMIFPTSFIFSAFYSEGLFMCLSLASFYFAQRKYWWHVGLFSALAAITRPTGILIMVPLAICYAIDQKWQWRKLFRPVSLWMACAPLLFSGYLYANKVVHGSYLAFIHFEADGWQRQTTNPLLVIWRSLGNSQFSWLVLAFGLGTLLITTLFIKRLGAAWWLWGFLLIIMPLSSSILGLPRYSSVVFPVYVCLAWMARRPTIRQILIIGSSMALALIMVLWVLNVPLLQ